MCSSLCQNEYEYDDTESLASRVCKPFHHAGVLSDDGSWCLAALAWRNAWICLSFGSRILRLDSLYPLPFKAYSSMVCLPANCFTRHVVRCKGRIVEVLHWVVE